MQPLVLQQPLVMQSSSLLVTLVRRTDLVLRLLIFSGGDALAGQTALTACARRNPNNEVDIRLAQPFTEWGRLLSGGYEVGYSTFGDHSTAFLRTARTQIERTLRSLAAGLVAAGAEVRGLRYLTSHR